MFTTKKNGYSTPTTEVLAYDQENVLCESAYTDPFTDGGDFTW